MIVRLPGDLDKRIREHAAAGYPDEACGLLSGIRKGDTVKVTGVHESHNITDRDPKTGFEIDPKLRFDLMRALEERADGTEIIGHYHSHPDHPAEPSATDLSMTYETEFIWLICAVTADGETELNAFKPLEDRSRFDRLALEIGQRLE
ncbi:MAG: M67 family metallopeptidase [Rhodospirillales bacterium]|nr:M67 family metallopeptidase [Rhodospirillales bacterium]MBO6785785.1 M67 family metallopeptidase [Rhodospirillales bacterium]